MQAERIFFPSSGGMASVAGFLWYPDGDTPPRAIVQIAHGMMDHAERYGEMAEALVAAGYAVVGNDHLGHGATAEDERELGYFGPSGSRELVVEDLHLMSERARERFPGIPLILVGHSMGSFLARLYAKKYGEELGGLVLLGTAGRIAARPLGLLAADAMIFFRGRRYRSRLLARMAFMGYNRRFGENAPRIAWLTRDTEQLERYAADPRCRFIFTVSAYRELFCMLGEINYGEWFYSLPKTLPVLIASGGDDPVGGYGKGVRQVARRLERAGLESVSLRIYEGARHELHHETNREEFFSDLLAWIEEAVS